MTKNTESILQILMTDHIDVPTDNDVGCSTVLFEKVTSHLKKLLPGIETKDFESIPHARAFILGNAQVLLDSTDIEFLSPVTAFELDEYIKTETPKVLTVDHNNIDQDITFTGQIYQELTGKLMDWCDIRDAVAPEEPKEFNPAIQIPLGIKFGDTWAFRLGNLGNGELIDYITVTVKERPVMSSDSRKFLPEVHIPLLDYCKLGESRSRVAHLAMTMFQLDPNFLSKIFCMVHFAKTDLDVLSEAVEKETRKAKQKKENKPFWQTVNRPWYQTR